MKVVLKGKVVSRSVAHRTAKDGTKYDSYQIVIEEPGKYPSRFQFSSKLASLFGQKDGPLGVGKMVVAEGFANGYEKLAQTKDGRPFRTYPVYFTLSALTTDPAANSATGDAVAPQESARGDAPAPQEKVGADGVADDIPF